FLFAFALMLAPLAAIFMLLVSWYMNVGTISRALCGLSGTLVMSSMAFAIFTPFCTLPGIVIPVFMAGTAVGVGTLLLVSTYARLEGPFKVLQPKSGSSAELSNTSHLVGSRYQFFFWPRRSGSTRSGLVLWHRFGEGTQPWDKSINWERVICPGQEWFEA